MIALVDADSLLYRVGFAIEDKVIWNEMEFLAGQDKEAEVEYYTNLPLVIKTFDQQIDNILFATECKDAVLVLSGASNFRMELPTEYKANRESARKPLAYDELRKHLIENYSHYEANGMEADDYVVFLKTKYPEDYILCAIDKDVLYQTEGTHYNYFNDSEITVTKEEAIKFAYFQTLTGDTTDGYIGCPSIGKVKAEKLLAEAETEKEMWDIVVQAYESKGLSEEEAVWTMRLANMHQFDGNKIQLWNPP